MCFYRVIDCTGDADIAHMAGAEYRKTGDQETKLNKTKQNRKTGFHHHPQMTTISLTICTRQQKAR